MEDDDYKRALVALPICSVALCLCLISGFLLPDQMSAARMQLPFLIGTMAAACAFHNALLVEDAGRRNALRRILLMNGIVYAIIFCLQFKLIGSDNHILRMFAHPIYLVPLETVRESWKLWHGKVKEQVGPKFLPMVADELSHIPNDLSSLLKELRR